MKVQLGMGTLLQDQRIAHNPCEILLLDQRLRHPGKGGELIHHASNVIDVPHDSVRTLAERLGIALNLAKKASLEALGGKLDRRQRVLDLMRDPPRHIGPRCLALC